MDDGARVFTDGDIAALRSWDALIASGAIAAADELPHVRAIGQTMSRLADWQVRELMTRIAEVEGTDETARAAAAAAVTAEMLPVVESLMSYTWRRHLAAAVGRILATSAGELSTATAVIGFADIVGYTSTVRHSGVDELAALLESFEENAAETIAASHGRVVKSLGDEVLFVADTAQDAAEIAVRLSDSGAGRPRPAAAAGGHGTRPGAGQVRRCVRPGGQPGVQADVPGQAGDGARGPGTRASAAWRRRLPAAATAAGRGARLFAPAVLVAAPAGRVTSAVTAASRPGRRRAPRRSCPRPRHSCPAGT